MQRDRSECECVCMETSPRNCGCHQNQDSPCVERCQAPGGWLGMEEPIVWDEEAISAAK